MLALSIKCWDCAHFLGLKSEPTKWHCKAFPEGIPIDISKQENLHTEIYPGQVGDYVLTPKENYGKL